MLDWKRAHQKPAVRSLPSRSSRLESIQERRRAAILGVELESNLQVKHRLVATILSKVHHT